LGLFLDEVVAQKVCDTINRGEQGNRNLFNRSMVLGSGEWIMPQ